MSYLVTRESFESLREEWQQALLQCAGDSLFVTPLWQQTWWEEMGTGDLQLLRVAQGETLLGIAPLASEGPRWRFLGDPNLFDYQDFVVPQGNEPPFFEALFEYLDGQGWETLDLPSLTQGSPTLEHLPALARQRGWSVAIEDEGVTPGLALPGTWEEYLAGLSKKDRHELRRKLRRLEGAVQYDTRVVRDGSDLPSAMEEFLTLMRTSRVDKKEFLTPEREGFFKTMARTLAESGLLRLYFLHLNNAPAAAALCFDYHGRRLLYNSGYDVQHAGLSVGLILNSLCLRDAITDGMTYFDFLRGPEAYKYDLGGRDVRLYHLVIRRHPRGD